MCRGRLSGRLRFLKGQKMANKNPVEEVEIVAGVIPGKQPTQSEVQGVWDSPISEGSISDLKSIVAKSKDRKPTKKQLELFGGE